MSYVSQGFKRALFFRVENFNFQELANMPTSRRLGNGFEITVAALPCFVHPTPNRTDILTLETNAKRLISSDQYEFLRSFIEGRGRDVRTTSIRLETSPALDFLRHFDPEILEFKLHPLFYDIATIEEVDTVRTKQVFNVRNVDEAADINRITGWDIRGASMSIERDGVRHYGFVFFDNEPTMRAQTRTITYDIYNDIVRELIARV